MSTDTAVINLIVQKTDPERVKSRELSIQHPQHREAVADGGAAQRDGEMLLADAGRAEQQQRLAMRRPTAGAELAHLARVD